MPRIETRKYLSRMYYVLQDIRDEFDMHGVDRFDMQVWGFRHQEANSNHCSTACCAAGAALISGAFDGFRPLWTRYKNDDGTASYHLGVSRDEPGNRWLTSFSFMASELGIEPGIWEAVTDPYEYQEGRDFRYTIRPQDVMDRIVKILGNGKDLMARDECWPNEPVRGISAGQQEGDHA